MKTITAKQFKEVTLWPKETLWDVRPLFDYEREHMPWATHRPLEKIDEYVDEAHDFERIYIYCNTGIDASTFSKKMEDHATTVVNIENGIRDWKMQWFPTIQHKKHFPLIQQVHIWAWSLILLGLLLAWITGNARFLLISGFVGAWLLVAWITWFCGMSKLLEHAPRNK